MPDTETQATLDVIDRFNEALTVTTSIGSWRS